VAEVGPLFTSVRGEGTQVGMANDQPGQATLMFSGLHEVSEDRFLAQRLAGFQAV
jgi:hypothetical protein